MSSNDAGVTGYLAYALAAAHRAVHQELARGLKEEGVQVEAWRIMEAIAGEQAMTMGRLADLVLLAPPTLTKMVDRMVADGLVQRQISTEDQRQVHLVLSVLGARKRDRLRRVAHAQEAAMLDRLGPEQARALQQALAMLAGREESLALQGQDAVQGDMPHAGHA